MDAIQIKRQYLEFMKERGWEISSSGKLVDSSFPHCFTISGAVDWYNRKLRVDPSQKDAFAYWVRCYRHYDIPDPIHLPLFWMMMGCSWDLHSREKTIIDGFDFYKSELGLDPNRLKITCWKGGKVYGQGINLKADVENSCSGPAFEKMQKEGLFIPRDAAAIDAWRKCGICEDQIIECGEVENLDPSGYDAILLNAREYLAGVRSEPYYEIDGKYIEIGVFLSEEYLKKTIALRDNIPQEQLVDDLHGDKFLLQLKPKPFPGGFGFERLAMVANGYTSIFQLEPYRALVSILSNRRNPDAADFERVQHTAAYTSALVWLVHDGANLLVKHTDRQRRGLYRKLLKTVISNLRRLGMDSDDVYQQLFGVVVDYYSQDEECQTLKSMEGPCLKEVYMQKERMDIEEKSAYRNKAYAAKKALNE